ncbi:uncharacterized protein RJT21DRAFT_113955 [Scheffersomyces amazonensis]|uniref:uncharacterized protein n=1 Tax=Scheffersomyces amazonensis TaxID=1078765 RepID=UPI00315D878A
MLDPSSDSNQLNEFPLIANSGGYFLDETPSFDETFSNSNYGHESPNLAVGQVGTTASNTGAVAGSNTVTNNASYINANISSPYNVGNVNAGHSYVNYGVQAHQQQAQGHIQTPVQPHQQDPHFAHQQVQNISGPQQQQQQLYSFSNNTSTNTTNDVYNNNRMFAANGVDYDLLSSHTPNFNYNITSSSDNTYFNSTFFDNSGTNVHYSGASNKYYSPQPMNNNPISSSLMSATSMSFDINHHNSQIQPNISQINTNATNTASFDHLSYTPPSTAGTTSTGNAANQEYYMNPQLNHTASAPSLLAGSFRIKDEDEEDDLENFKPSSSNQLITQQHHQKVQTSYGSRIGGSRRYRVIRGVSAGGSTTRPPKQSIDSDAIFLPVELSLNGATIEDICYPQWSKSEKDDGRRIIRIERVQKGPKLIANFSIVGSANENPTTLPAAKSVDVVEVSCLKCKVRLNDEYYDSQSSGDEDSPRSGGSPKSYIRCEDDGETYQYYITSVEVVEIVELLIGTEAKDSAEKRRERGRVRSNLVPFWSKKPISSRMNDSSTGNSSNNTPTFGHSQYPQQPTNQDYRVELAKRIMGYEIRKPRGFDKEVRILRWDKLVPALKRALQSYYTEIPQSDAHIDF